MNREVIHPRADDWLGDHSGSEHIRRSGLWNVDHVTESYDPGFLDVLETHVERTTPP